MGAGGDIYILNAFDDGEVLLEQCEALLRRLHILDENVLRHAQRILQLQPPIQQTDINLTSFENKRRK